MSATARTVLPAPSVAAPEPQPSTSSGLEMRTLSPEEMEAYRRMMDALPTENDEPVDNLFSEKQQRLLADVLYSSWSHPRFGKRFLAAANVGVFFEGRPTVLVPDLLLSLDVEPYPDVWAKEGRSYFNWVYGKPPDVIVEVVSNTEGEELGRKAQLYQRMRVGYYVVYDPQQLLIDKPLQVMEGTVRGWQVLEGRWLDAVELGVTLWEGAFEGIKATWLRWCDRNGQLLPTGRERAEAAERQLEAERRRAELAEREVEQLRARLRALGVQD
ncbi:MAG: Uma2 family endonuclease [Anaerolineae bacterium]|nr:Uma2 family endonuclease [Anaerolineae bacterium]